MTHRIEALLGETILKVDGQEVPVRTLCGKGKVVGFYFSASWCAPCKTFTPLLISFYNSLRQGETTAKEQLEMVHVSWDRDAESYNEAIKQMPWYSLPFEDKERRRKLSRKLRVHGFPRLVLLDGETGSVITRDGFDMLTEDPAGAGFPWRRKALVDVIKGKLLRCVGESKPEEVEACAALEGCIVGFYFSAHWSPSCRHFDTQLIAAYQELKARPEMRFEVVFGSVDRSPEAFRRHTSGMPWLVVPYDDARNTTLKKYLGVDGIPMFVLVDAQGTVITTNGRQALTEDPGLKAFPWFPKPVEDLTPTCSLRLNENVCVLLFTDGTEAGLEEGRVALWEAASREAAKEGEERDLFFYVAFEDDFADMVRDFADLDDRCPLLVILDSPEQTVYVCPEDQLTPRLVTEFIDKFLRGEQTPTPILPILTASGNSEMEASAGGLS